MLALLCLLSTIALGCGVFKAIFLHSPFLGFYFLNLHLFPCFGCFIYIFLPLYGSFLCVFFCGTACAMLDFPTYVSSSLQINFLISSSVEYLLCCFLISSSVEHVCFFACDSSVCLSNGGAVRLCLLCVSLSLVSSWSCVVLVYFTFLFVLRTTYVLWYTQPVLRGYLLFVANTGQI